jgi:hypothetical protein
MELRISVEDRAYMEDLVPPGYQILRITRILHAKWISPPVMRHSCDARCRGDASPLFVDVNAPHPSRKGRLAPLPRAANCLGW